MVGLEQVVAVLGTYLGLAAFLSLTAFIAARNVLGAVPVEGALLVGPVPALASFLQGLGVFPPVVAIVAVVLDLATIRWVYDVSWSEAGYVTVVHVIVSILLGAFLASAAVLILFRAPGG